LVLWRNAVAREGEDAVPAKQKGWSPVSDSDSETKSKDSVKY